MTSALTPKALIGISLSMLILAGVFGVLNTLKVKTLHAEASQIIAQRDAAQGRHTAEAKTVMAREVIASDAAQAITEAQSKAAKAEGELAQVHKEKADLQAKIVANEAELTSLQKNIAEVTGKPAAEIPGTATTSEMEAQLDESRRALDGAEQEKGFLLEKLRVARERSKQLEDERKRRVAASGKLGIRGTILAVNQTYNFVVLNLGGRQGVEANSEMLVVRDGALIGKIRISSVEPATAIGDIITGSLARGVQVQRGDVVIYAGSSS
jgi:hypothetical protein